MSCVMISIIKFSLELFINFRISVDSKEKKQKMGVEIMIQSYSHDGTRILKIKETRQQNKRLV